MPPGEAKNLGGVIAIDIANGGILKKMAMSCIGNSAIPNAKEVNKKLSYRERNALSII